MCKSAFGLLSQYLNLVDPSHVLDVQDIDQVVAYLILKIMGTKVTAEEDHQHLKQNTTLLLHLLRILP